MKPLSLSARLVTGGPARQDGAPWNEPQRARCEIWNLRVSQCSVVGTCCTLSEIRKIGRKTGVIKEGESDYRVHTVIVAMLDHCNPTSKAVQKLLDEKYAGHVRKVARLRGAEEFRAFWSKALSSGLAPGAYWALSSTSHTPDEVIISVFGEIHMMSHLCGASTRGGFRDVSQEAAAQAEAMSRLERERRSALVAIQNLRSELASSDQRLAQVNQRLAQANAIIAKLEAAERPRIEPKCVRDDGLRIANRRIVALESELSKLRQQKRGSARGEAEPIVHPSGTHSHNLGGCRLLYVGGVPGAVCKIRELTERCAGCFLYHDGGLEQSVGELDGLASRADMVLLPVRNVSHQAARRIKAICHARGVPFVPLRSSSVSAFLQAVGAMGIGRCSGP